MRKHREFYERERNSEEQDCSQVPMRYRHSHPRRMHSPRADRFKRHHPEQWRSSRRAVFYFGLIFSFITLLIVSGIFLVIREVMQFPERPPGFDGDPKRLVPLLIFLLIIGALIVTSRFSRRKFSNPLEKILDAADRIANGDLTTRIEGIGYGPFERVETAFNHMVEELEHSDQIRRDQTADIAHELNTPIHIIRDI